MPLIPLSYNTEGDLRLMGVFPLPAATVSVSVASSYVTAVVVPLTTVLPAVAINVL